MTDLRMKTEIARFITGGEGTFEDLALRLHREQVASNVDLRAFCAGRPAPEAWWQIPAVPVTLFRDLALTCFPPSAARFTFQTSGTTGRRGVVHFADTALYDLGSRLHAVAVVGALPDRGVFLVADEPDSSLAHMCRSFVSDASWFVGPDGVDAAGAAGAFARAEGPLFVGATAFALQDFLDLVPGPFTLPPGSIVMVTGGFKGRSRSVSEVDLTERSIRAFPGSAVVGEYGMTELSSQLWASPLGVPFVPPPWLRVRTVDPWTSEPAEEGILQFFDLANVDTVLAIETADVARIDARGAVHLVGRLEGAEPRGCSLTIEDLP